MSTRETYPRHDSSVDENTQAMPLSELFGSGEEQRTVVIPTERDQAYAQDQSYADDQDYAHDRDYDLDQHDGSTAVQPRLSRAERRAERDRALGTRRRVPDPQPEFAPEPAPRAKRTTDRFLGSFGLFVLRLVVGAIMGLHGFAKVMDIQGVQGMLGNTLIPEPIIMSYVLGVAELAIAVALVLGFVTRLAGLGVALIGIGALVFVLWVSNPFTGLALTGELELLLAASGLVLLCVGAGGWSLDRAIRGGRGSEA